MTRKEDGFGGTIRDSRSMTITEDLETRWIELFFLVGQESMTASGSGVPEENLSRRAATAQVSVITRETELEI
jgi:hypothetical protein